MNAVSNDFSLPAKVREIASQIRIGAWDFEGAVIATEVVMIASINAVLAENGIKRDINEVEREVSGRSLTDIFEDYKKQYGLRPSVEEMKARRADIYVKIVDDYLLKLFPFVEPLAKLLNEQGAEQFFLSNGTHAVIEKIAREGHVYPDLITNVLAGDSPARIAFCEKYGIKNGDKAGFLAAYSLERNVPPFKILLVEDNPKHIQNAQKKVHEAWCENRSAMRKADLTKDTVGEIQEIFVENEFNQRRGSFTPNTGIKLPGFAPRELVEDLKIH